jgi:excisionase family DNA binding protein
MEPLAVTLSTAADVLAVSPRTIRRLLDAGELQRIRIGRSVRISAASLRRYIEDASNVGNNRVGAAVQETSTCRDDRREIKTDSTNGRIRRSGGRRSPTDAADRLAAVLALPSRRIRRG